MKQTMFVLIILNCFALFAQDREPSPWQFKWGYSNTPRVFANLYVYWLSMGWELGNEQSNSQQKQLSSYFFCREF